MSHRVSEGGRFFLLVIGTLAWAVILCLALAGAVQLALAVVPWAAPVLVIVLGLAALVAGYLGFMFLLNRIYGRLYG